MLGNGRMMERLYMMVTEVSVPNATFFPGQVLVMDDDADFYVRAIAMQAVGSANFRVRMKRADGSYFMSAFRTAGNFTVSSLINWLPIYPEIRYPASGKFEYDIENLDAAATDRFQTLLIGVKKFPEGSIPKPAYPSGDYREAHYKIPVLSTIAAPAAGQTSRVIYDQILQCDIQAPFAIRSLTGIQDIQSGAAVPIELEIRLKDEYGRYYSNDFINISFLFSNTSPKTPGILVPEVIIPKSGSIRFDLRNRDVGANTFQFCFQGAVLLE